METFKSQTQPRAAAVHNIRKKGKIVCCGGRKDAAVLSPYDQNRFWISGNRCD